MGNKVINAENIGKSFGSKHLFSNLNFMLPPNGIVGVIGPNGAGKTTLFRMIMGLETADEGTFEVGETVKIAYVDQNHKDIVADKSVYEVMSQGNELMRLGGKEINVRAYLSRFNFSGADQEKKFQLLNGMRIQANHRLIEQQHFGFGEQSKADIQLLLHTFGKLITKFLALVVQFKAVK